MTPALREMLEGFAQKSGKVFTISRNNIRRKFERACELAEIGHCRIHDLRHTFASHLVMAGTPLNTVRELLGHTSMTMTLKYSHLAPEATAKAKEGILRNKHQYKRGSIECLSFQSFAGTAAPKGTIHTCLRKTTQPELADTRPGARQAIPLGSRWHRCGCGMKAVSHRAGHAHPVP